MPPRFQKTPLTPEIAQTILGAADLGTWMFDVATGSISWDEDFARILGIDGESVSPDTRPWAAMIAPDDLTRIGDALRTCASGASESVHLEYEVRRPDGTVVWIESRGKVVERDADGEPVSIGGAVMDCTSRKKTEAALRASEDRLRAHIENTGDAVWCFECAEPIDVDLPGEAQFERLLESELVECNRIYAKIRGAQSPEALYGKTMREVVREAIPVLRELFLGSIDDGYLVDGELLTQQTPFGTRHVMAHASGVVRDRRLHRIWGSFADVTERQAASRTRDALERQLAQVQRMDGIGALAGGVAHDFNNILLAIAGHAELASADVEDGNLDEVRESLAEIQEATNRAAEMTRRLLAFGRRDDLRMRLLDVCTVVEELHPMLRRLVPASIDLRIEKGETSSVVVEADRTSLEQVLVNLVVNARDAIDESGSIVVRVDLQDLGISEVAGYPWVSPGKFAAVEVRDDGAGIDEDAMHRIFDPFFTTKEVGKGTGLGLAVVYGIMRQHGGLVRAESQLGEGTRIRVLIPRAEARVAVVPEEERTLDEEEIQPMLAGGIRSRVLLAEDNPMVRATIVRMLESVNLEVVVAVDGAEAIDIIDRNEQPFDVAILDAVMPGRSGRDVFEHLNSKFPDVPVIFASGYGADVMSRDRAQRLGCAFLTKPFDRRRLFSVLALALGRADLGESAS